MQELETDREFFDWLRAISTRYGDTMAAWGQEVHDAAAEQGGTEAVTRLAAVTDRAVEQLVESLLEIGKRHDEPNAPRGAGDVLASLDRLLGTSVEMLRDARAGLTSRGLGGLSALAPRIAELRSLEEDVEHSTERIWGRISDTFGDPGKP